MSKQGREARIGTNTETGGEIQRLLPPRSCEWPPGRLGCCLPGPHRCKRTVPHSDDTQS